jgi:signal transduction histidine kinase
MGTLTIFRGAVVESDDDGLRYAEDEFGASVETIKIAALRSRVIASLATGAVVLVALDDRMATLGLGAGVDEILRAGQVTRENVTNAVERANVRSIARSSPEFRRALFDQEASLAFLLAAFSDQLREPLAAAAFELEILNSSLPAVFDAGDELATWAALSAPIDEVRRLVGRRLAAPSSSALGVNLRRLALSLTRARHVSAILDDLVSSSDTTGVVDCGRLVTDLCDVLKRDVATTAALQVETEPLCKTTLPKGFVALLVVSLIVRSLSAIRSASRTVGEIKVSLHEEEGAIVLEVADNGAMARADLRPDVLEGSLLDSGTGGRTGLAGVRDRLRQWGGELLVDTHDDGTVVRAMLPAVAEQPLPEQAPVPILMRRAALPD